MVSRIKTLGLREWGCGRVGSPPPSAATVNWAAVFAGPLAVVAWLLKMHPGPGA